MTQWEDFDNILIVYNELEWKLYQLLEPLEARERTVLKLRLGIDERRTLEEVGEVLNLTRERIRQIEARAMSKLRLPK